MVIIPRRSRPQFLKPDDVVDGDLLEIVEPPYIQPADKSKFGKERTVVTVCIKRTDEARRWSLNTTSNDRLVDVYGENGDLWADKEVKVQKRLENVRGSERHVLYALPSIQQNIAPTEKNLEG